ncbi:MAG: outer membrane protein assembly factor BamD [Myxococcota bacterium]
MRCGGSGQQGATRRGHGLVLAALMVATGSVGCTSAEVNAPSSLTYTEDAYKAYQEALRAYRDKEWESAQQLFSEVKRLFNYSKYAKLAELRLGDIDFNQEKYPDAITTYRAFVKAHRDDPNVEYARYRICKALYLDINDTFLLPPQEERDQSTARDAHRELKAFVDRYPESRYRVDARYMYEVVTQRIVRHDLYVGRYYLNEDRFRATVMRVDHALENYPGSGLDAEAMVLKAETLLKMKQPANARAVFTRVVDEQEGGFVIVAKRFLAQMGPPTAEEGMPDPDVVGAPPVEASPEENAEDLDEEADPGDGA